MVCRRVALPTHNPLAGLRRPRLSRAERLEAIERARALSDAEMYVVWHAAASMGTFGGLVQLALLTAMRRGELSGLRWSDVKDDRIILQAQQTESGVAHEVPLTDLMREVLAAQPRTVSPLVFPSRRTNSRIRGCDKLVNSLIKSSAVNLTLHDTRRTTRTLMSRLGVMDDVAELAIGHQRTDCPSSDDLRPIRHFENGGSGSSGVRV